MVGLIFKILWKIYKTPLILLHAARLNTSLTGVWSTADLSRKALALRDIHLTIVYEPFVASFFQTIYHADVVVQSTESSWHVPFDDGTPLFSYQRPVRWMCTRRKWHNMGEP